MDVNDNAPVISGTFNMSVSEDLAVPFTCCKVFSALDDDLEENAPSPSASQLEMTRVTFLWTLTASWVWSPRWTRTAPSCTSWSLWRKTGVVPRWRQRSTYLWLCWTSTSSSQSLSPLGKVCFSSFRRTQLLDPFLLNVRAEDADIDDDVKFELVSGNGDDTFVVDRDTGSLYLVRVLDREERSDYELVIQVSNL